MRDKSDKLYIYIDNYIIENLIHERSNITSLSKLVIKCSRLR